jgi:prepilin signal peptidase PulO-like enzyme (type II secretory pathway)
MLYIFIFLFGLIIGSFANVLIYRLPRGRAFVKGRSQCPGCGVSIAWYDLIPIISFLFLKTRCRKCGFKISWIYPAIEAYSGIVFVASFVLLVLSGGGGLLDWVFSVLLLEAFLVLIFIDFKHLILPDSVILFTLIAAFIYGILAKFVIGLSTFKVFSLENITSAVAAFGIFFLIWLISKGKWMGFGDVKLAGLVGLVFGAMGSLIVLYLAIVLGAIVGLVLLAFRKANLKTQLPLGSFIGLSASAYILFNPFITEKIMNTLRFVIPLFRVYN